MIDHLSTYATDYPRSRAFYDAVLPVLGYPRTTEMQTTRDPSWPARRMCAYGPDGKHVFWLIEVRDPVSPRHVAFSAADRAQVDAFHAAGLASGGRDNGGPGLRPQYHASYYGSFLLDPDGNNVEAVTHRG